jgi:Transcriptional regulators
MMLYEILENHEDFTEIEQSISTYVLHHPNELEISSARSIAKNLFVSASAVTRFTQKLGYEGYNDFRRAFLEEDKYLHSHFQNIDPNRPFLSNDSDYQISGKISTLFAETVADTQSLINYETLEHCASIMSRARIIYVFSAGSQLQLGQIFSEKMAMIGKQVITSPYMDVAFNLAANAKADECFLLVSYSGETRSVLKTANKLKAMNHPFISLTSYGQNTLSTLSTHILYLSTREHMNSGIGNYGSYISAMYLFDVLYSCIFKKNYKENLNIKYQNAKEFQDERRTTNPILKDE